VTPGFGNTHTPPSGSTVRTELPNRGLAQAPQSKSGPLGRLDGFEDWVSSIVADQGPSPWLAPPRPTEPSQRLMGVADVLSSAHVTMGGPASAVPPKTMAESDFYVMKPTSKRPKPDPATKGPRSKLAFTVFILVLLAVLAAVAIAFFYLHH
jgi:hypothetical protein